MNITFNGTGKKYYREWIFRNVNLTFTTGQNAVILGPNGSGKSTFLQLIAGAIIPNEGNVSYKNSDKEISPDEIFTHVSFASPYLELIEEFTLREIIRFHFRFKSPLNKLSENDILNKTELHEKSEKVFRYFSSGMKQRVKLALAILSDTEILLLDEPCSNLDVAGVAWYKDMIASYALHRTIIVASNQNEEEYSFCETKLNMTDFKK